MDDGLESAVPEEIVEKPKQSKVKKRIIIVIVLLIMLGGIWVGAISWKNSRILTHIVVEGNEDIPAVEIIETAKLKFRTESPRSASSDLSCGVFSPLASP